MRRFLPLLLLPLLAADAPPDLVKQVRALEPLIEKARGLKFKKTVAVRVIPRGKDSPARVHAYYDVHKKEVVLYDDIKSSYFKGVVIHELIHALQDQHFDLKKLHQSHFGSDAELARAALVEGDAQLVVIEMLKAEQPRILKMLETDLSKSRNIQNAFLYGQGARWVKATKDKGGWAAVNRRYIFPPQSTAAILHPGVFIQPVKLGPGKIVGEFGIIRRLAAAGKPLTAASGWRGDRLITEGKDSGWAVAFATEEQAKGFQAVWSSLPAQGKATVTRVGKVVYEVNASTAKEAEALLERLQGKPLLTVWSAREKKEVGFGQMLDALVRAEVVCVGESHDSVIDHHVQAMIVKGLYALDGKMGVGFEMFQKPSQKALDRYVSGALAEEAMLEDVEWKTRWGYDWGLYRPIADFCKRNGVPMAALNISTELRKRIVKTGLGKLTAEDRKLVGEVDLGVKAHRDWHFPRLAEMHGGGKMKPEQQERMYEIMAVWDDYMADSAVKFLGERKLRRVVVLAGRGHIEKGFGIPDRAARRLKGGIVRTVRVVSGVSLDRAKKDPMTDFVIVAR